MAGRKGIVRAALGVLVLGLPGLGAETGAVEPARPAAPAQEQNPVVARGRGLEVRAGEIVPLLLDRYAMSRDGRDLLKLLLSARVIDQIAGDQGLQVSEAEINALWDDLDRQARAVGDSGGLEAQLAQQGLGVQEFREYLRLTLLQEELTRRALGKKEGAPVTPDQQEIWLNQELTDRGATWPPPPWTDGIAARCGSIEITTEELGRTMLEKMSAVDVKETAWHLLLLKGIEKRMPDLAPQARREAVDAEMARRRAASEAANETRGVAFEDILAARGSSVETLRRDPSVSIAALTRRWVDQVEGPEGLRREYNANRDRYEGLFGKAVHAYLIFLVAAKHENELNQRTYGEAEAELERLKADIHTLREFTATSARYSEEATIRQGKGDLGWVARSDPRYPAVVRDAIFEFLGTGGEISAAGCMLGPVRLDAGVGLLWLSAVRESPPWEVMSKHVHEELRRRFIEDVMPAKDVQMVLR